MKHGHRALFFAIFSNINCDIMNK